MVNKQIEFLQPISKTLAHGDKEITKYMWLQLIHANPTIGENHECP